MSGSPSRRRRYDSDEEEEPPRRAPHNDTIHRVPPRRERSRSRERYDRSERSRRYTRPNLISEPRQEDDRNGFRRDDRYAERGYSRHDQQSSGNRNRDEPGRQPVAQDASVGSRAPPKFATGSNSQPLGSSAPAPSASAAGAGAGSGDAPAYTGPVEKPNFGLSGALAKDDQGGRAVQGVALKWSEPTDAAVPAQEGGKRWRLFIFEDGKAVEGPEGDLPVYRSSAYLFGRDITVCDVPLAHPSISSQHAVLQYRRVPAKQAAGDMGPPKLVVKPYVLDLGSTNGTFLNGERIESARFIELLPKDVLRFGSSTREYVLLHE